MQMPFGKYQGHEIEEIPKDYLKWVSNNLDLYGDLRTAIFDELVGQFGEKWNVTDPENGPVVV